MFVDRFIFEESYFAGPADSQQAIERFSEAAARLRISAFVESIAGSAAEPVQGPLLRSPCTGQISV
jgi:hypothetical protein